MVSTIQTEKQYVREEQELWLSQGLKTVKRAGYYMRQAIVRCGCDNNYIFGFVGRREEWRMWLVGKAREDLLVAQCVLLLFMATRAHELVPATAVAVSWTDVNPIPLKLFTCRVNQI